jgi:hypothetical protein
MTVVNFKISENIHVEYIYDSQTKKAGIKILFKFNTQNTNWLYLNLNPQKILKFKQIFNLCSLDYKEENIKKKEI